MTFVLPLFSMDKTVRPECGNTRMSRTEVYSIDPGRIEEDKIEAISFFLKNDAVIAFPTDTFYGLGSSCYSRQAVERIFSLKARQSAKPLPLVISDFSMLLDVAGRIPPVFEPLAEEFWPGLLTLIFKASEKLPSIVTGGRGTVGVRFPDFAWLQALIRSAGFPLTATSANLSGGREISDPARLVQEFGGVIDLIVDGGRLPERKPSTVVDISSGGLSVVREGAIPASAFSKYQKKIC